MRQSRAGYRVLSLLCAAPLALSAQVAVITGTVRDGKGAGVTGAEVSVEGSALRTSTDDAGRYRLAGVSVAPARVVARRLGYLLEAVDVTVTSARVNLVDFRLDAAPQSVEAVTIVGRAVPHGYRLQGFYDRARQKNGGHYITRAEIERRNASDALQLIRIVPSVKIGNNTRYGRTVRLRGGNCQPLVFIDGFPATAGPFDFESLDAESIEGIEVYSGVASTPPELTGPHGGSLCGVIAIWGRQFPPSTRRRATPKLTAAALAATRVRALVAANIAYATEAVDTQATFHKGSFAPRYPESLLEARAPGSVRVEFVVDSVGAILWETYSVIATTDARFNEAVREALLASKFSPAVRAGRHVAQVVQVPVDFVPPAAPTAPEPSPAGASTRPAAGTQD